MRRSSRLLLIASLISVSVTARAGEAPLSVWTERASAFRALGLESLARRQYELILSHYPSEAWARKESLALNREVRDRHAAQADQARAMGALPLAIIEMDRALAADPKDTRLKRRRTEWAKEDQLRRGMDGRISQDYLAGVAFFREGKMDRALESFLRVLNLDPNHKGALNFIERIGQRIDVENP